jgi:hypothetical protein
MNQHHQPADRRRARATRRYALLLQLYPRAHRRAFGPQMRQAFADHFHDAIELAGEDERRFWLGVLGDASKSVAREHLAALTERTSPMKASRLSVLTVALLVGIELLLGVGFVLNRQQTNLLPLLVLAPGVVIYTLLLVILAQLVRAFPRAATSPTGLRLGAVLGGIVALYVVVLTAMIALLPVPAQGDFRSSIDTVLDLSLPLLAGVVGVIGGCARGSARTGALLGALTGFLALVVALASQALCIILLWNALQHHQLQSRLAWDYQGWLQSPGLTPNPGSFLHFEWAQEGSELFLFILFLLLVMQEVMATIGGALGARASRRAGTAAGQEALSGPPPGQASFVRLALSIVGLDLLAWALYDLLNSSGGEPFSLTDLIASFASPAFFAWLLAALAVVVAVHVAARPGPLWREGSAATMRG